MRLIHITDISHYIKCNFYHGRIRTLVALATYIFHILIMGNVEMHNFSVSIRIFGLFKRNVYCLCLLFIKLLSKSLNLIGCQGDKKVYCFEKKNLLFRKYKVDEADTLHTCV